MYWRQQTKATRICLPLVALTAVVGMPRALAGQDRVARGREALDRCAAAVRVEDAETAAAAAAAAERAAEVIPEEGRADALVIRARVLTGCRIPFANFMRQGTLLEESNELLRRALSVDPSHLGARFVLAMNHYHTPAFLGRIRDAAVHFQRLLAEHGDVDDRRVAAAYYYLGVVYERMDRHREAAATWRRGAARFSEFEPLQEKARELGSAPDGDDPVPGRDSPAPEGGAPGRGSSPPATGSGASAPRYELEPIVVEAGGYSVEDARTATRLTRLEVYTLPGGTADVLQTFKTMPGVTQVTDGSDLYVRGGDPAESPIYVDGARLFYPGRFETLNGSMFGILDPATLRKAYFSSGGFSARYGNALSGVVDIETEDRPSERRFRVGANLTSLGMTLWQPLGGKAGFWGTGSVTETSALLELHGRGDDYPGSPWSYQGMAGAVLEPTRSTRVKLSGLVESDETTVRVRALGYEGPFTSTATSRLATLSVHVLNDAGNADLRVATGASSRESGFTYGVLDRDGSDRGLTTRADAGLYGARVDVRAGLEASMLKTVRDGTLPAGEELVPGSPAVELDAEREATQHVGGYAEVESRVTRDAAVIAGLRLDRLSGERRMTVDPRLAAAYRLDDWSLRLAAGVFSQGRWRVRNDVPDAGRPNGLPLRARHLVLGAQREGTPSVRVEAYLKDYDEYEPRPHGVGPVVVDGRARGVDVLLRWVGGDLLTGWLAYSFLHGWLELADGTKTPSDYDVTHTLSAVVKAPLARWWEFGLTARYATGRPFTPILGAEAPEPGRPLAPEYGATLSARYPSYRRLDARLTRYVALGNHSLVLYLEGLNVLARRNVMGYTYDDEYRDPEPVESFFADRTLVLGVEAAL